uniref:LRRCT domain-containing protein n=1 Tax=Neogobius melanostomus TaxID=47308 RepID=A0A8C6SNR5_9GOBI
CCNFLRAEDDCPVSCMCARESGTVTCRDGEDFGELPVNLPEWTSNLIVQGKNLSILQRGAFIDNTTEMEITTVCLSYNGIQVIEPYAFLGLSRLHLLDLSHNRLESISTRAFFGLPQLRSLYLNYSFYLRKPPQTRSCGKQTESYSSTAALARLPGLNPFHCNCDLEEFYYWLKNSSQCPDAGRLMCSEPESKRGALVERLRAEDVDCNLENLEAVSYVFLGLVLALIGVVFLMVLYLNRGGIKRWLNNIREACRDQMEIYHYRYEQDSDPRLANVAV